MTAVPESQQTARSGAVLTIDLDALAANYARLIKLASPAIVGAVVKADAYGLGLEAVAGRLAFEGCRDFFVAHPGEGRDLRALPVASIKSARIYVLGGLSGAPPQALIEHQLIPALVTLDEVELWTNAAKRAAKRLPALLFVDTGLNRLGIPLSDAAALTAQRLAPLDIRYVISHLASSEDAGDTLNALQRSRFEDLRTRFPGSKASLANSGGVLLGKPYHYDLVRCGYALYGGNPSPGAKPMHPVVTLEAPVLQVRQLAKDDTVGYGASFRARGSMRVATIGAGYADGIMRALGNGRGGGWIADRRVPFVGRISMDLASLDVTGLSEAEVAPGTMVQLIGAEMPLEEVASAAGTIGYEILTRLGRRLVRDYRGPPAS